MPARPIGTSYPLHDLQQDVAARIFRNGAYFGCIRESNNGRLRIAYPNQDFVISIEGSAAALASGRGSARYVSQS